MVTFTDHGVLFAKNSDRDPNESQIVEWHPARTHSHGTKVATTWITIPQVQRTNAIVISRPWWIWGAEMGANEHGLVIGNEAVFTTAKLKGPRGLIGMDLVRLALERAQNAPQAVEVIVELLQTYGQAGPHSHENPRFSYHNSFLIADPTQAIVVETAGKEWATEEVRERFRAISNGLTIPAFARAYSDRLRTRVSMCHRRRHVSETHAAQAATPADLFSALRDNGTSTGPKWSIINGSMAGPNMHAGGLVTSSMTACSWVSDVGRDLHWVTGSADPALSLFLPLRVGQVADFGPLPRNVYDPQTWWWAHEGFRRQAARDWLGSVSAIEPHRDEIERTWLANPPQTQVAIAHAQEVYHQWADLIGSPADTRPSWVRRLWDGWDRQAHYNMARVAG